MMKIDLRIVVDSELEEHELVYEFLRKLTEENTLDLESVTIIGKEGTQKWRKNIYDDTVFSGEGCS